MQHALLLVVSSIILWGAILYTCGFLKKLLIDKHLEHYECFPPAIFWATFFFINNYNC